MFKQHRQNRLEKYVRKYFLEHQPKLIAVAGSVGKTTTKVAIATLLSGKYRVAMDVDNHHDGWAVPLAVLGIEYPPAEVANKLGTWRKIFSAARKRIKWQTGVDVIVQELGIRGIGEMAHFGTYLQPDIAVVTAVAPEHMENFAGGIDDVAREELAVAKYSKLLVVNRDDVDMSYAPYAETTSITDYGLGLGEYRFESITGSPLTGYEAQFWAPEFAHTENAGGNGEANMSVPSFINVKINLMGEPGLRAALAAATVAVKMGLSQEEIVKGLAELQPVNGRMNVLEGVRGSTIIDDTYSSSPRATIASLLTLYQIEAKQRIAILGSMNDLGNDSPAYHTAVGEQCDPNFLDWVITIGEQAARYLAPAARKNGCQVASFPDPISAGTLANRVLEAGGVVLAKGSEQGVFAEEAIKILLAHTEDIDKLVRQTPEWMGKTNAWIQNQQPDVAEK